MLPIMKKNKIQIPEIFWNETLHQQTQKYWKLSQAWNGISNVDMTINDAIQEANSALSELNPNKPLARKLELVKTDIVVYGTKKRKAKQLASANINVPLATEVYVL